MVRELTPLLRPKKAAVESVLNLPSLVAVNRWDRWAIKSPALVSLPSEQELRANPIPSGSVLGLPTAEVYSLALWLQEFDELKLPGMIALQLELRGWKTSDPSGAVPFSWEVVGRDSTRSLVLVGLLPPQLSPALLIEDFDFFDLSVRYRDYAENSLTLWREGNRLCFACTRGSGLVHFQSLSEHELSDSAIRDLDCITTALKMQEVLSTISQIILWCEVSPSQRAALQKSLGAPVSQSVPAAVRLPKKRWNLQPLPLREYRKNRQVRQWQQGVIRGLAALYALVVGFYLIRLGIVGLQVALIQGWVHDHEPDLRASRQTAATWLFLSPVVETQSYPLETLLHCANILPPGSHLTQFEQIDDQIHLQAEARDASQAYTFLEKLQHEPALATYLWTMEKPRLLPNDLAQLQIEGTHETSH